MDMTYEELKSIYNKYFSLGNLSSSFTEKMALISLVCYITEKLKAKKPDVTHYQIIRKLSSPSIPEDFIKGLAIVCEDFAYCTKDFPTFDLKDNDIPKKISELLERYLPF